MADSETKKNIFQYVVMGLFILFAVIAVVMFASTSTGGKGTVSGNVVIWGTIDSTTLEPLIGGIREAYKGISIKYETKSPERFDDELLNALAAGTGPDLFILPEEKILKHQDKLFVIPYENYPQRTFQEQFVDEANLFLAPEGVLAFPLLIDPMVMYYNRDILNSSFLIKPPEFWDEFLTFAPQVTRQTESGQIIQSAVALGSFDNVNYAKDIFVTLMMQVGNPLVQRSFENKLVSTFRNAVGDFFPAESALRFYTMFSNPSQESYSWNVSLRNSRDAFLAQELAVYFGYASEIQELRILNPNLNFDVSLMPQNREVQRKLTFGKLEGLAISRLTQNLPAAFTVASVLTSPEYVKSLSDALLLPPVRKEVLVNRPTDPFLALFYDSAVIARSWLDPEPQATDQVFRSMINGTISGSLRSVDAIEQTDAAINNLLP